MSLLTKKRPYPFWLFVSKKPKTPNTTHPYGREWKRLSKIIKAAAGNRCSWCPAEPSLNPFVTIGVHHIDGNPYNNHRSNLIVLCNSCHRFCHSLMLQGADIYNQFLNGQLFFVQPRPPEKSTQEDRYEIS